ncbi:hypothetical protein GAO09_28225 [Rhizobiales bacterium RZME27]|uniref:Uncharacterized protein n=1 Tax=Endobacterium cereale TaxID=2663029 RepID=A0A6A8AGL3_9HYPH|nr:hypothetical protein [Endobacterium cereale]MEB2842819.1 hypothetical protein [Endobacterium cereale]MQY49919.1 hypothetical protein [Endobacterium cereale]
MPLIRLVSDGIRSVRGFFEDRQERKERQALMAKRQFRIASSWDELGEHEMTARAVEAIKASGEFEKFEPLFLSAHAADVTLPSGCALHEALMRRILDPAPVEPQAQRAYLAPFFAAFETRHSPHMAGLLANALIRCSDESRGADVVDETSDEQWGGYSDHRMRARQVLDACADVAGSSLLWQTADYHLAIDVVERPRDAVDAAFERVWMLDRYNLNLCADHGIILLPRWVGRGPNDLEVFARRALSVTEDRFGAGAYGFIYSIQAGVGSHDVSETLCDPDLVVRGFEDLIERFPTSQSILNRYAMAMDWIGDLQAVYRIQKRINTINPNIWVWSFDDQAGGVDDALNVFLDARDAALSERFDR